MTQTATVFNCVGLTEFIKEVKYIYFNLCSLQSQPSMFTVKNIKRVLRKKWEKCLWASLPAFLLFFLVFHITTSPAVFADGQTMELRFSMQAHNKSRSSHLIFKDLE